MLFRIYAQPLGRVVLEIVLIVLLWAGLRGTIGRTKPRVWRVVNLCLLAVALFGVVYTTILDRSPGEHELILLPGYFLIEGRVQREVYRALLMNVLLFAPFGLTLSAVLESRCSAWCSVLFTCLIGLGVSLAAEATQYLGGLGRAETDDVLANLLGAFLGASHVPLGAFLAKRLDGRKRAE